MFTSTKKRGRPTITAEMDVLPEEPPLVVFEETLKRMGLGSIFHPSHHYKAKIEVVVKKWPHGGHDGT